MRIKISSDKKFNDLCHRLLATGLWTVARQGGGHTILKYTDNRISETLTVPSSPSDLRAFQNFWKDYCRKVRRILIRKRVIFSPDV